VAGLFPDPLGELTTSPRPPSWIQRGMAICSRDGKRGGQGRGGEGSRKKERRKRRETSIGGENLLHSF